jgi:hypothetical protein
MTEQFLVDGLSAWLVGRGFSVTEDRQVGGFENIRLRFHGESCEVHLIRNGGAWEITLTPPGGEPKLPPQIWRYYLDHVDTDVTLSEHAEPFEVEVHFVQERLDEVIMAARCDENIGERLTGINWVIVKDRLGLDPAMPMPGRPGFGKS